MILKALITAVASLSLASCIVFGSTLEPEVVTVLSGPTLEKVSSEPLFYSTLGHDGQKRFLTLIKDCTPSKQKLSALALARQLLVGLEEVQILSQTESTDGQRTILQTTIRASLDQLPLAMQISSYKSEGCVFDMAIWLPKHTELGLTDAELKSILTQALGNEGLGSK